MKCYINSSASDHMVLHVMSYIMLRSHIEWQQKTLLFVIYTSGFQQPCQRSLLPHGTTLISLFPIANGIIIDISYQCFCQIYVRFPSSCNHFVITNKTVIREVSLHGCTCSLKLSWYLWQRYHGIFQIPTRTSKQAVSYPF